MPDALDFSQIDPAQFATPPPGDFSGWVHYERFYLYNSLVLGLIAVAALLLVWRLLPRAVRLWRIYVPIAVPILAVVLVSISAYTRSQNWERGFFENGFFSFLVSLIGPLLLWTAIYLVVHWLVRKLFRNKLPQQTPWALYTQLSLMALLHQGFYLAGLAILEKLGEFPVRYYGSVAVYLLTVCVVGLLPVLLLRSRMRQRCFHCQARLPYREKQCEVCGQPVHE